MGVAREYRFQTKVSPVSDNKGRSNLEKWLGGNGYSQNGCPDVYAKKLDEKREVTIKFGEVSVDRRAFVGFNDKEGMFFRQTARVVVDFSDEIPKDLENILRGQGYNYIAE